MSKYRAKKMPGGWDQVRQPQRSEAVSGAATFGAGREDRRPQIAGSVFPHSGARDENGNVVERAVKYIADFVYTGEDGKTVVEDTKGMKTPAYIIKRKLMRWVHSISIKEV